MDGQTDVGQKLIRIPHLSVHLRLGKMVSLVINICSIKVEIITERST